MRALQITVIIIAGLTFGLRLLDIRYTPPCKAGIKENSRSFKGPLSGGDNLSVDGRGRISRGNHLWRRALTMRLNENTLKDAHNRHFPPGAMRFRPTRTCRYLIPVKFEFSRYFNSQGSEGPFLHVIIGL